MQAKNYALFSKELAEYLYQNKTFELFQSSDAKWISTPGESEEAFRQRIASPLGEKLQEAVQKIRDRYSSKIRALQDKIQKARSKVDMQKAQAGRQKLDAWLSAGTTLLGTLFGQKLTKGSISQAGTSIRKMGRMGQGEEIAQRGEESVEALQSQLESLNAAIEGEVGQLLASSAPNQMAIQKVSIRPKKGDISIDTVALVWIIPN